jgi:beta-phosphoglucomutase-like phosphatase (HAD superfamily)
MHPARVTVPERSFAIEDTPAGIRSAKGAGLRVLAVTNSYGAGELAEADWVADSLENVRIA